MPLGNPAATVNSITIQNQPRNLIYEEGDYFDPTDLSILVTMSDGTTKIIDSDYELNNVSFRPSKSEKLKSSDSGNPITVIYEGHEANTNNITVNNIPVLSVDANIKYRQGTTESPLAETVTYMFSATLSGNATADKPYIVMELDKKLFMKPGDDSISSGSSVNYINYDVTEDAANYYFKINFSSFSGGITLDFPVILKLNNKSLSDGDVFNIPTNVYDKTGRIIGTTVGSTQNSTLKAKANATEVVVNQVKENVGDSNVTADKTKLSNEYVHTFKFGIGNLPKINSADYTKTRIDKRDTRVTAKLQSDMVFDSTLANNDGWHYDVNTHSVYKDFSLNPDTGVLYSQNLDIKFNNRILSSNSTNAILQYTTSFVNGDGTLDTSKSQSSGVTDIITYIPKFQPGTVKKLGTTFQVLMESLKEKVFEYTLGIGYSPQEVPPVGTVGLIKSVTDTPSHGAKFVSYKYYINNLESIPESQRDKINENKLIGTKNGVDTVVATNITAAGSKGEATDVVIPDGEYDKLTLVFNEEISFNYSASFYSSITLELKMKFSEQAYNTLNNEFNTTTTTTKQFENSATANSLSFSTNVTSSQSFSVDKSYATIKGSSLSLNASDYLVNQQIIADTNFLTDYLIGENRNFINPKLIILVPKGLDYNETSVAQQGGILNLDTTEYEIVENYKNTNKTAYIHNIEFALTPSASQSGQLNLTILKSKFTTTYNLPIGSNKIEYMIVWDNYKLNDHNPIIGKNEDIYDANGDGDKTDQIAYISKDFNFTLGNQMFIGKEVKEDDINAVYSNAAFVESTKTVEYKIEIFNNTTSDKTNFTVIDILPYLYDSSTLPSKDNPAYYASRGSRFSVALNGEIDAVAGYTYYYSTDEPTQEFNDNLSKTWLEGSEVQEFSKVTMIKIVSDDGTSIHSGKKQSFTFKATLPKPNELYNGNKASNTVVIYDTGAPNTASESTAATVNVVQYNPNGYVYYDVDENGEFDGSVDLAIRGRTVSLYRVNGTEKTLLATTKTNSDGKYSFANIIDLGGDFTVEVELISNDKVSKLVQSNERLIGNEVDANGIKQLSLSPTSKNATVNAALQNVVGKVTVEHWFGNDYQIENATVLYAPVGSEYATSVVSYYNEDFFSLILVETPSNAVGKHTKEDILVKYVYKRKDGADVTVKYVDENGKSIAPDLIISGKEKYQQWGSTQVPTIEWYEISKIQVNDYIYDYLPSSVMYSHGLTPTTITLTYKELPGRPIPIPTPTPPSKPADPAKPVAPANGRTCQDDGYPVGYYWSESAQACVINRVYVVPKTSETTNSLYYLALAITSLLGILVIRKKS